MVSKPRFTRDQAMRDKRDRDEVGRVGVSVFLRHPKGSAGKGVVAGNITRTLTISEARVSEVMAAIEAALFGETQ